MPPIGLLKYALTGRPGLASKLLPSQYCRTLWKVYVAHKTKPWPNYVHQAGWVQANHPTFPVAFPRRTSRVEFQQRNVHNALNAAQKTGVHVKDRQNDSISGIRQAEGHPAYCLPTSGLLAQLPSSWIPYAELARLDKPTGSAYLFFPCLFSTLMVSTYTSIAPVSMIATITWFGAGALVMRGAGCTINDLWDRNLDPQVARTRLRPLARKAVSPPAALLFAGAQCLTGLMILLQFPQPECLYWGAPSLVLVGLYPLAKRITNYPQFVLGLTFSWGALMGFPALGVDLLTDHSAAAAALCLYASCVSWTVLYDMIYAHMDLKDDRRAGIKSIALAHEKITKQVLTGLAVMQIALLAVAGNNLGLGTAFYAGSCGASLCTLLWMIRQVRLEDPDDCWRWFQTGAWLTGGTIALGLFGDYLWMKVTAEENDSSLSRS